MLEALLDAYTLPGALVIDPMCGSGSTLVAAARTGRRYIGIEIDTGFAALARERLAREDA